VALSHKARVAAVAWAGAFLGLILALTAAACGEQTSPPTSPAGERGVVANVADGDSLRLDDGREVRLVQIDAPELYAECYGHAARRALLRLAPRRTRVALVRDAALDDRDAYGRLLRYVLVRGRNVNLVLVGEGAAQPYFFRNERGGHAEELLRAAKRARARRLGLWGACPDARLNPGLGAVTGRA
jgi:endonuclease YncB( thermonuclease family)